MLIQRDQQVGAFSNSGTYSSAANGYYSSGSQDGNPDGVQGYTMGANNAGVFGRNNDSNGVGVFGIGANGIGVFGQSSKGPGVSGHSDNIGVYGESTGNNTQSGEAVKGVSLATSPNANVTMTGTTGKSLVDAGAFGWNTWAPTNGTPPANAVGVFAKANSGVAIVGKSDGNTGVLGGTANASGIAVNGVAYANSNYNSVGNGTGVLGQSGGGIGVEGVSTSNYGVYGTSGGTGVWGNSSGAAAGVLGTSTGGNGVVGSAGATGTGAIVGQAASANAYAGIFAGQTLFQGTATAIPPNTAPYHGVLAYGQYAGAAGVVGIANGANTYGVFGLVNGGAWAGYFSGATFVNGNFYVQNGVKSAVVPHPDGTHRALYCVEAPESWFEDFGEATLSVGTATVTLDADYAAVVDTSRLYVFVTPQYAQGNDLAVTGTSATGFTVTERNGGKSSGAFAYRVVAKRKDVAAPRLAKVTPPAVQKAPTPPAMPASPSAIPATPAAPTIPTLPHHAEEDTATQQASAQAPRSADSSDSLLLAMTREAE